MRAPESLSRPLASPTRILTESGYITDPATGEIRFAEIFVAVLGASSFTYCEASWSQTLPDWIGDHVRMFRALGGVPRLVVPDNLKSGVNKASFYDPEINLSYGRMASHYGIGVLPARPRRPKDKTKVEAGVRFAQSYILGRLRAQKFFSLAEANQAIAGMVARINDHIMRRLGVRRRHLFETIGRPALAVLPNADYEFAEWGFARVSLDYQVEVCGYFYSVPHNLIRAQVDTRATARMIEIFFQGNRIAAHEELSQAIISRQRILHNGRYGRERCRLFKQKDMPGMERLPFFPMARKS